MFTVGLPSRTPRRDFGATSEQQRPNIREDQASSGTRRRSQASVSTTLYGLQNLHRRFESARRLQNSLGNMRVCSAHARSCACKLSRITRHESRASPQIADSLWVVRWAVWMGRGVLDLHSSVAQSQVIAGDRVDSKSGRPRPAGKQLLLVVALSRSPAPRKRGGTPHK